MRDDLPVAGIVRGGHPRLPTRISIVDGRAAVVAVVTVVAGLAYRARRYA